MPGRPVAVDVLPTPLRNPTADGAFSWEAARRQLQGLPGGQGINIAHEAVDRLAGSASGARVAFRFLARSGARLDVTYAELRSSTNRFASLLNRLGVVPGDRVYALLGRIPELFYTALGTLKHGSIFCPLFSAFGPEPIRARLAIGQARVLVTSRSLYHRKIEALRPALPELEHVLLVGEAAEESDLPGTLDLRSLMDQADDDFVIPPTRA